MIEKAIVKIIRDNAEISAMSKGISHRTIELTAQLPAISYKLISDPKQSTLDNQSYRKARMQINAVAKKSDEAHALAKLIEKAFTDFRGEIAGVTIFNITEAGRVPDFSQTPEIDRVIIDYTISYGE